MHDSEQAGGPRMLSNKSPRHAITACSRVISFPVIWPPFHLALEIKQVSGLINLTDRAHCAKCQPKRKPYCLLSWWLTFLLFFDSCFFNGSRSGSPVIDLKTTASSTHFSERFKQKLCLLSKSLSFIWRAAFQCFHLQHLQILSVFLLFGQLCENKPPAGFVLTLPWDLPPCPSAWGEIEFIWISASTRMTHCLHKSEVGEC